MCVCVCVCEREREREGGRERDLDRERIIESASNFWGHFYLNYISQHILLTTLKGNTIWQLEKRLSIFY